MDNISKLTTHICLLGDDPSANLTPLADSSIPSQQLIIAYEEKQQDAMLVLKQVAKTRGIKVKTWLLPTTNSTEAIKLSFMHLFEQELTKDKLNNSQLAQYWLNATNGTRQQVLSAYEIARSYKLPIFIVEPKHDELCWLYPEGWKAISVKDHIKLHEFLLVNGCQVISKKNPKGIAKRLRDMGLRWLSKSDKLGTGLAKLNYLGAVAKGQMYSSKMDKSMLKDESLQWLLDELKSMHLIEVDGKMVHFKDSETQFFCNGGWLEETTFGIVRGLASELKTIQDDGHSVEIERTVKGAKVLNELDVVALVNNKLFVIECKTKHFSKGEGSQALYKLDSIAERLGGIKAKAALVTFFPISVAEERRARELDIQIFSSQDLPHLKQRLSIWLNS